MLPLLHQLHDVIKTTKCFPLITINKNFKDIKVFIDSKLGMT